MFRRYTIDITDYIKEGRNIIRISFESAITYSNREKNRYPVNIGDESNDYGIPDTHRAFIRKTQSDFGWDWGPVFVPCGIYKDIEIISINDGYIEYVVPNMHEDKNKDFEFDMSIYLQVLYYNYRLLKMVKEQLK